MLRTATDSPLERGNSGQANGPAILEGSQQSAAQFLRVRRHIRTIKVSAITINSVRRYSDFFNERRGLMKRGKTGIYDVTSVGGEQVRAFIPNALPPVPPLAFDAHLQPALEAAVLRSGGWTV